jgi:hypothetical protein
MKLTDKTLERIIKEANKAIRKDYRMLGNDTVTRMHVLYVLQAYMKVVKREH